MTMSPKMLGRSYALRCPKGQVTSLDLSPPIQNTVNTVGTYIHQINTQISESLLGSAATAGTLRRPPTAVEGGRPDDGRRRLAGRSDPRSCWRGGRGPNQCVGPIVAVPPVLTMAILNKSGKKFKERKGLQFRIKKRTVS